MEMEILYDRKQLKLDAKDAMRTHRPSVYLGTLVFVVITYVLELLSLKLEYPGMSLYEIAAATYSADGMTALGYAMRNRTLLSNLLSIAIAFMSSVVATGYVSYCLNISRRLKAGVGEMFDVFGLFFKVLWLQILIGLFTMLWSLLLIVPGIIASYRYSMALFILLDDPNKSAMQCIAESKQMMDGYKAKLFVMDLSFIGWALLSVIPFVVLYTTPYMQIARANFYRFVSGNSLAPASAFYWENHSRETDGTDSTDDGDHDSFLP